MFCWKGSWKIYFIYFAAVYVKLRELNFIIGNVKISNLVVEQGRRCMPMNRGAKKENASSLFQIGSKCQKLMDMLSIK